jgi:PKD repeat protein
MTKAASNSGLGNTAQKSILEIPVVVHILHDNGIGNISEAQVLNALEILNNDYNRLNADSASTRNTLNAPFQSIAGSMDVLFKLAKIDPQGECTNGIIRVNAPNLTYNTNDDCKYAANGGSDQWPMDKYLNLWVVNSIANDGAGIILGYAYLPYWPSGTNYGILIRNDAFGTIGTAMNADGRTLTHEMGHLLGLQHIFDAGWSGATGCHTADCSQNGDYCCDTPPQETANWSCSPTWNSCADVPLNDAFGFDALDQIENFMSYNACQNMFSRDQANIMQQNFIDIDFLAAIVTPENILATGINEPTILCKADFTASKQILCSGDSIQLNDQSFHNPTSWTWSISPGIENIDWAILSNSSSNSQNPSVQFFTGGKYQITLTSSDGTFSATETKNEFITVLPQSQTIPYWEGFENFSDFSTNPNWIVYNAEGNNAFTVEQSVGLSSNQSAFLQNYGQNGTNSDELISSSIDLSTVNPTNETVTLSFRYAYIKRNNNNDEWLKVFVTNNCGESWVQRKTIHGNQLSPDFSLSYWAPSFPSEWTTVHMVNITAAYFVENFRFKFEFEGSNGNNFYIDDINLYKGPPSDQLVLGIAESNTLAEISIFPNPSEEELTLRFAVNNADKGTIYIRDISGKVSQIAEIQANSGSNVVLMETSKLSAGMYLLTLNIGGAQSSLPFVVK